MILFDVIYHGIATICTSQNISILITQTNLWFHIHSGETRLVTALLLYERWRTNDHNHSINSHKTAFETENNIVDILCKLLVLIKAAMSERPQRLGQLSTLSVILFVLTLSRQVLSALVYYYQQTKP